MGQCTGVRVGAAWVIRLEGSFLTDQDAVLIEESFNPPADVRCVVVNWAGILVINSTSLGAVMRGEMDVTKRGYQYRNCAFSDRAARIVRPFRRSFPWNYFETEDLAVQACASAGADPARSAPI
jgi:hypothetical protein